MTGMNGLPLTAAEFGWAPGAARQTARRELRSHFPVRGQCRAIFFRVAVKDVIPSLTQADIDPEISAAGLSGWGREGAKHGRDYYFIIISSGAAGSRGRLHPGQGLTAPPCGRAPDRH
jgi:hypothetical protein